MGHESKYREMYSPPVYTKFSYNPSKFHKKRYNNQQRHEVQILRGILNSVTEVE